MSRKLFVLILLVFAQISPFFAQSPDNTLISADKKFIQLSWSEAAGLYEKFLSKNPKDFYASRQAAISYHMLNNQSKAIDHWTNVYENSLATEKDKLEYGKCLLANYRTDNAKMIFRDLIKSTDPAISSWGKAFSNINSFYEDSALCKVYEVAGFKTEKSEYSPVFFRSELIYVTEEKKNKPASILNAVSNQRAFMLYSSGRTDSTTYKKGKVFNKQIQSKYLNGPVCITPDDSVIYFTRTMPKAELKKAANPKSATLKLQIFYTQINTFGFAHPEIKPFPYNSTEYDCMHPAIDKTGKKLYFASDMPGTLGGKDIWMCEWKDQAWSKPVNLGPQINSSGNEAFPFVNKDGVLYFASDNRPGLGGFDLFFADPKNSSGSFSEAENMGAPINTQFDDFGISFFNDGKRGYFSSNRKNDLRDDDIYFFVNDKPRSIPTRIQFTDSVSNAGIVVEFTLSTGNSVFHEKLEPGAAFNTRVRSGRDIRINASSEGFKPELFIRNITFNDTILTVELKPKSLKCIAGKILDKDENKPVRGMKVAIYDEDGNNYLNLLTDTSGNYKVCQLPLDKDLYIGSEKKPDYFSNTDRFRIKKDTDLLKDILAQKIVIGKPIKIDHIYFDQGKFNVRPDAATELDKLVRLMKDNPEVIIELSSHTDCTGPAVKNLSLSDKRAKSSADYIVKHGIDKKRITGKGYGESKLVNDCRCEGNSVTECTEEQHAQNRRVEIKVTGLIKKK